MLIILYYVNIYRLYSTVKLETLIDTIDEKGVGVPGSEPVYTHCQLKLIPRSAPRTRTPVSTTGIGESCHYVFCYHSMLLKYWLYNILCFSYVVLCEMYAVKPIQTVST